MVKVSRHLEETLEKNLASLRAHRPELFRLLLGVPLGGRYQAVTNGAGRLTVAKVLPDDELEPVMPGADPIGYARASLGQVPDALAAVILAGAGDGIMLAMLAAKRLEPNPLGIEQPVVVIEPDLELLVRALQIHDLGGPKGPLEDPRFVWCVGPAWVEKYRKLLFEELAAGAPKHAIRGGAARADIESKLQGLSTEFAERLARERASVQARYAGASAAALTGRLGEQADRQPVVLFVTSLFTTVLRHTTHDLARAFEAMGFRAVVVLEDAPHRRLSPLRLVREVLAHEPALVVVVDHARHEFSGSLPPELPFVSWIQDELPGISSREAAKALGARDFLWLRPKDYYEKQWGYPERQLIQARCLTTPRALPEQWPAPKYDLVYLSHAAKSRRQIANDPLEWVKTHGLERARVERLTERLIARYDAGDAVFDLRAFVAGEAPELGPCVPRRVRFVDGVPRQDFEQSEVDGYAQSLYRAASWLHRQQGLRWAIEIATERGYELGLFGHGWDALPEFQRFWRGSVEYQRELVPVLQASRASLHLEPWSVVAHWRGLDAFAAGSFVLARRSPQDDVLVRLAKLVDTAPEACSTLAALARCLPENQRSALGEVALDLAWLPFPPVDPVAHVLALRGAGIPDHELSLPRHLARSSFGSKSELERSIARLIAEPDEHRALARTIRSEVLDFYAYERGARELVAALRERLGREPAPTA